MYFFDSEAIEKEAGFPEWVEAMEKALHAIVAGDLLLPRRMHLDRGRDTFLLMPCISDEYWATKLVSFCPGNREQGKPSIYGTVVLSSSVTGEPLAIMDGTKITSMRTAAVTAAGIKLLSPPAISSLGIIGTGIQGLWQALFACSVREIREIRAFDEVEDNLRRFEEMIKAGSPDARIIRCRSSEEVCLHSEVIITATNSPRPVIPDDRDLFTGKTFIGIGSYKPDCREFPEQLFRQLDQVFVDTPDGRHESGDLITPADNRWLPEDSIHPLGELLSGKIVLSSNPTRLFKTVGSAIFDLYAAKLIYENHINKQL